MNIGLLIKVITHLGGLSEAFEGFEAAAKDLFAGNLSEADAAELLKSVEDILATGLISLPDSIDSAAVVASLQAGEIAVGDVIASVKDIESSGIRNVPVDLKKVLGDVIALINAGNVKLQNHSAEQVVSVLSEIQAGL